MVKSVLNLNIIGDSLSYRSNSFGLQNKLGGGYKINDYSVEGRNTHDWLLDTSTPFATSPNLVIIELGTNDAMTLSKEDYQKNILLLIQEVQKRSNAKIFLTAVPLTDMVGLHSTIRSNNDFIRSLSKQFTVVDLENVFQKDKDSVKLYPYSDPIHPNPIGYEMMGEAYRTVILDAKNF